jgi:hypothetical protein
MLATATKVLATAVLVVAISEERVADPATGVFWLVLPSIVLFITLPLLLRAGVPFAPSLIGACALAVACYFLMLGILKLFGVVI